MFNHPIHKAIKEYEFILCSSSPRRIEILQQIGFNPIVKKSNFKEDLDKANYKTDLVEYVQDTAYYKIIDVFETLQSEKEIKNNGKPLLLLSADTVILCNNKIYEKPKDFNNNVSMLKSLRDEQYKGNKIEIVTCCVILINKGNDNKVIKKFNCKSEIKLINDLNDKLIEQYCLSGEGQQVAGGFKIQGFGSILFDSINGDFYNCVGLPASKVFNQLCDCVL